MASIYQKRIKIYNGTDYDEFHPLTDASVVNMSDGTTVENKLKMYTTTNSGNAYSVTIPNLTSLTDGLNIRVKFNVASTGIITLNINSLGAKSVKDYFGNSVTNVRANLPANLVYESTSSSFILLGKGGGGDATADHLLVGDTATVDSGPIAGTMPNKGAVTITPGTTDQAIPAGYHNGSGKVKGDADLKGENIRKDVSIFDIVGTLEGKQDFSSYLVNIPYPYVPISFINGEGLWAFKNGYIGGAYCLDFNGSIIKTVVAPYGTPTHVTDNYIVWINNDSHVTLTTKDGTLINDFTTNMTPIRIACLNEKTSKFYTFNGTFLDIYNLSGGLLNSVTVITPGLTDIYCLIPLKNGVYLGGNQGTTSGNNHVYYVTDDGICHGFTMYPNYYVLQMLSNTLKLN